MGENGGKLGPALREAGYSPTVVNSPSKVTNTDGWKALTESVLPDELLVKHHRKLLTSTHIVHMTFPLGPKTRAEADLLTETAGEGIDEGPDELYLEALAAVREAGHASTSYLQRKLRVGYSRAAMLMDLMEEEGIIGPADGSKPREVLVLAEVETELEPQPHGGSLIRRHASDEAIPLSDEDIMDMFESVGCRVSQIIHGRRERMVWYFAQDNKAIKDALDLAYKIKGKFSPDATPPPSGNTYNIFTNPVLIGQVNAFEDSLKNQLIHAKPIQENPEDHNG